jgi:hypothetical protein
MEHPPSPEAYPLLGETLKESDINLGAQIHDIHERITGVLTQEGVPLEKITRGDIRLQSVLYMIYWFRRMRNNHEEQYRIRQNLAEYISTSAADPLVLADALFSNQSLQEPVKNYVESLLVPTKTVDLVITKAESAEKTDKSKDKEKEVLCIQRTYYPLGLALPGGIIKEEDEDNELSLPAHVFAALRVAGEKVLGLGSKAQYFRETDSRGKPCFLVRGETDFPAVRLYPEDEGGYRYHENIKSVLRPSDPRHIVDTIAFKCEVLGEPQNALVWRNKSAIMSPETPSGGFAFGHHREIVAHITSQTSVEKEREIKEREFIRSLIKNPLESYHSLKERFEAEGNSPEVSFKELFPVVDRLLSEAFSEDINKLCSEIPLLAGIRDKAVISLRHVALKNRTFCPYLPTLHAIGEAVAFFDVVARQKKGFYDAMQKDRIVEHNPRNTPYASYHMYRYKYRLNQLMNMVPDEIVIPTFEPLSATDLMRVRGVPIRFVGISLNFLYVDEFEQSPEEFLMHDCNHSWRMAEEDKDAQKKYGKTKKQLIEESNAFIGEYLDHIKIRAADTEEQREMKKLKKIILFEIVHEDARPFLKEVIGRYIQLKEGNSVPFEVPRIDPNTGYMDVVDTLDTGISTLSYVRNKLQHGFYDHIDAQLPQIVGPKYRTAEWITRAAYEMLVELGSISSQEAQLDTDGHVSYEWLLRRTCAVGPDNIHGTEYVDPAVAQYGDEAERLNPKRYQAGQN